MQPLKTATKTGVNLSLSFLNLTVSVHAAVGEDTSAKLTTLCAHGDNPEGLKKNPIKQKQYCPSCANEDRSTFVMGRSDGAGDFVVIDQTVKDAVKAAGDKTKEQITITTHPASEVSSVLLPSGKSYYLALKSDSESALAKLSQTYTLLSRLIDSSPELAFMCKFTLSSATSIFQLTTAGNGTLVLRQMANAELVRTHPVIGWIEPDERQLDLAKQIAEQEVVPFVEIVHGTGKSNIIAEYVEANAPAALTTAAGTPAATVSDMTAQLEAMLAASKAASAPAETPVAALAPVKAKSAKKRSEKVPA